MFRIVPECSGMFHVPGFIDAPYYDVLQNRAGIGFFMSVYVIQNRESRAHPVFNFQPIVA